ncbi:MAG: sugar phosphate isomerase/epimerase family protein [Eubacteriales bacterium]|nr:sugar phosphate isomerase/epimerase family protein [Eubacteriales bacterium]
MKLCIRAHDLGVQGTPALLERVRTLGLDGVQMVCYKAYEDIAYQPGAITPEKAQSIGDAFRDAGVLIPMIGAYFNPVHSDSEKVRRCTAVFADYLRAAKQMGCGAVGSETGSFNDDKWTYHPRNRTEEALQTVVATFSQLCDVAQEQGVVVAMEGAAGHVCWNVETLARARRMMGRKTKVIFDLYNYLDETNQGDYLSILEQGLDTFGGEILMFHMKDCQFVNGQRPAQVPLGTGEMDMRAILSRIKSYDENAVLTLEGTTGEHILHAVATIKSIWESV